MLVGDTGFEPVSRTSSDTGRDLPVRLRLTLNTGTVARKQPARNGTECYSDLARAWHERQVHRMAQALKDDHTGRMWAYVLAHPNMPWGQQPHPDLSRVDREQLASMVEHLREAEASTRDLRRRLEGLLDDEARLCPECGTSVTGRADAVYCGARCRQRARRALGRG